MANLVLVTGAAGAIGSALAHALAAKFPSAHLALVDVDEAGLARCAQALGARASTWPWDLSKPAELEARWAGLVATRGEVDVLVNCAGIMHFRSVATTPWPLGQKILDIDLVSPLRLMSLAAPPMVAAGAGYVINVSSMAGRVPLRGCSFYGGAKAGLAMASEIAHLDLAPSGVHVVTVYPGPVASALERGARAELSPSLLSRVMPLGSASTIAGLVIRAIDRKAPRVVYPRAYAVADRAIGVATWVTRRFSPAPSA
jgi:short-subunit dehydrogenase